MFFSLSHNSPEVQQSFGLGKRVSLSAAGRSQVCSTCLWISACLRSLQSDERLEEGTSVVSCRSQELALSLLDLWQWGRCRDKPVEEQQRSRTPAGDVYIRWMVNVESVIVLKGIFKSALVS